MKKFILLPMIIILGLAKLCAQGNYTANYRALLGKDGDGYYIYGDPTEFPVNGVASDFGPRYIGHYDWHGGVDLNNNEGGDDFGDLVLAVESGRVHRNGPTRDGTKFIIIEGDEGHDFAYQHILNRNAGLAYNQLDEIVHGGVKLKRINNDGPTFNNWAMIICNSGDCTAIGPVEGEVTFKDEKGETRTIYVFNTVNRNQPIASLGNTWYFTPHLHLQIMQYLSGESLPFKPDAVGINPLSVINHVHPAYAVNIIKNNSNETIESEGIDLVYPGTSPSKILVRCKMLNEDNGANYTHGVGNINLLKLRYKKQNESVYRQLDGSKFISKIDYGGILGANTQVSYPKSGNTENMHFTEGSWNGINGIRPRAYSDNYGYPWDDFFFTDIVTRIHKNHVVGQNTKYADFPSAAKYNDGKYDIEARMTPVTVRCPEFKRHLIFFCAFLPDFQ